MNFFIPLVEPQTEGLLKRESFAEIPPRVKHSLTNDGAELRKSIISLLEWIANRSELNKSCALNVLRKFAHTIENIRVKK